MNKAPDGYRWLLSPDGYQANLTRENEARYYPAWADFTDLSKEEVADLMEQRRNNEQMPMAA